MILSEQWYEAQNAIADMEPNDPGDKVKNRLVELKDEAPDSEAKYFDEMWEAYMAAL